MKLTSVFLADKSGFGFYRFLSKLHGDSTLNINNDELTRVKMLDLSTAFVTNV